MNCSEFNELLDLYMDGELNENQRVELEKHAEVCTECREKLEATEQLRGILSHLDDEIAVPLPAQAAWRNAIRAQAKRDRMKRIYRVCGAVAAVFVLMFGVTSMLRADAPEQLVPNVERVEADGMDDEVKLEEAVTLAMDSRKMVAEYPEHAISVEDPAQALIYLKDLVAEYGGAIERETEGDSDNKVYVQIPGESAADFISALDGLGTVRNSTVSGLDETVASIGICVIITGI